jgi:hypothetical protein
MDETGLSCEECGHLGVVLSGMHPTDGGVVRWTLYRCGHMKTEIELDEVPSSEPDLHPSPETT